MLISLRLRAGNLFNELKGRTTAMSKQLYVLGLMYVNLQQAIWLPA
jgi:hypothetical protein